LAIAGDAGTISGSSVGATNENDIVDYSTGGGGSVPIPSPLVMTSVWVTWTPSYSGLARIDAAIDFEGEILMFKDSPTYNNRIATVASKDDYPLTSSLGNIPRAPLGPSVVEVTSG